MQIGDFTPIHKSRYGISDAVFIDIFGWVRSMIWDEGNFTQIS